MNNKNLIEQMQLKDEYDTSFYDLRFLPTYLYDGYMKEKKRKERLKKYNKIYEKL